MIHLLTGLSQRLDDVSVPPDPADLLPAIIAAAQRAGEIAMAWFRPGALTSAGVQSKEGGSPVTEADHAVDRMLLADLHGLDPSAGWLSEETADTPERLGKSRVFIVDPIDGTRGFVAGDPRWAVSIALVVDGLPRVGVLHLPALGLTFSALEGAGAWRQDGERVRVSDAASLSGARVAGAAPLVERFARTGVDVVLQRKVPSLAYRIAMVANGDIEAGFASTNAHDWDIAAADLIVHEAGGFLIDAHGRRPVYNRVSPKHGVLAAAPERFREDIAARLRRMT
ncbi:MAG: inositol monophosphatase [Hyphomicrobiales bacterium]|nr:inositol monophosphatase [Hyphomicrobiales bacterium]